MKIAHWSFFVNFFVLMWIGSQHPETPFVEIGQFATAFYFSWFLIIVPVIGIIENTLFDLAIISRNITQENNGATISADYSKS
jgi:ubiquinol-cytochrome c reductase cytochrome b subunit